VASRVFVVGAPLGVSQTLTVGYLSARRMAPLFIGGGGEFEVLQTDAAINPGNSGGPMFNMQGEVIGVVSYILSESGSSAGLGFAISARTAREQLLERKAFWSGIDYVYIGEPYSTALNLPPGKSGLLVQRVAKGSGGERLGLRGGSIAAEFGGQPLLIGGDIILSALGVKVGSKDFYKDMGKAFEALPADGSFEVVVLRAGRERKLKALQSELIAAPGSKP